MIGKIVVYAFSCCSIICSSKCLGLVVAHRAMLTPSGQVDDATWNRQTAKRVAFIAWIHASADHRFIVAAGLPMPELPDPRDRRVPKRQWEIAMQDARHEMKRMVERRRLIDRMIEKCSMMHESGGC